MWKPIKDFPDYRINEKGEIIRNKILIKRKTTDYWMPETKIARTKERNGSLSVRISNENGMRCFMVHNLVASHFLRELLPTDRVVHIDGDKKNNNVSNLKIEPRTKVISRYFFNDGKNGFPEVTDEEKEYIRKHSKKKSIGKIAEELGRGWNTIDKYQKELGLKQEIKAFRKQKRATVKKKKSHSRFPDRHQLMTQFALRKGYKDLQEALRIPGRYDFIREFNKKHKTK